MTWFKALSGRLPCQHGFEQFAQHTLGLVRKLFAIGERLALLHIGALRQLQLHGVDAVAWLAVMTGDVAALEAPVQHMAVIHRLGANALQLLCQSRIATGAIERTEVEVRQLALEQVRDLGADRVGVP